MGTSGGASPGDSGSGGLIGEPTGPHKLLPLWEHPFADVYAAGDGQRKRALLLSFVRKGVAASDAAMQRCTETQRALQVLRSAFIFKILETRRIRDGRLVLAGDLLEGTTLAQHLLDGPMAPARAIPILRQVCHALDVAHGAGIRHGALSAASVILTSIRGREDTAKVTDFGLAGELTTELLGDHEIELQPLSPEKVLGGAADRREDIYLLGAIAYATLSGRFVFEGAPDEVRLAHASGEPKPLDVPPLLAKIVGRCLAKRPEDRYENVRQVEDALIEAQRDAAFTTAWDDLPRRVDVSAHGVPAAPSEILRDPSQPIAIGKIPSGPFEVVGGRKTAKSALSEESGAVNRKDLAQAIGSAAKPSRPRSESSSSGIKPAPPVPRLAAGSKSEASGLTAKPASEASAPAPKPASEASAPAPKPASEASAPAPRPSSEASAPAPKPTSEASAPAPKPASEASAPAPKPASEASAPAPRPGGGASTPLPKPAIAPLSIKRDASAPIKLPAAPATKRPSGPLPAASAASDPAKAQAERSGLRSPSEISGERRGASLGLNIKSSAPAAPRREPALPKPAGIKTRGHEAEPSPDDAERAPADLDLDRAADAAAKAADDARSNEADAKVATRSDAAKDHKAAAAASVGETAKRSDEDAKRIHEVANKADAKTTDAKPADAKKADAKKADAKKADAKKADAKKADAASSKADEPRAAEGSQVVRPTTAAKKRDKLPTWMWAAGLTLFVGVPLALIASSDNDRSRDTVEARAGKPPEPSDGRPTPPTKSDPTPEPTPADADDGTPEAAADDADVAVENADAGAIDDPVVPDDGGETPPSAGDVAADVGDTATPDADPTPTLEPKPTTASTAPKKKPAERAAELVAAAKKAHGSGNLGKAESLYKQALGVLPKYHPAAAGLGQIYFNKSNYAQAATYYTRAVNAAPGNADYRIRAGDALFKQNKFAEAKKHYVKAKSLGSSQADARIKKCDAKLGK